MTVSGPACVYEPLQAGAVVPATLTDSLANTVTRPPQHHYDPGMDLGCVLRVVGGGERRQGVSRDDELLQPERLTE